MKTDIIKGFRDFTGKDAEKFSVINEVIRRTFEQYNFEQVRTPIIESEEFVKGENANDEAVSDIYKLTDKGKRKLALRYEFTFQLKRIANGKKLPYKRFQIGPVFRDEPVTGNRLRQFTQCDIDVIGSNAKSEAEVLAVTKEILDKLEIKSIAYVNNRKLLNEILDKLKVKKKEEVIREIDKLDKLSEKEVRTNLKEFGAEAVLDVFKKPEKFFEKYEFYSEIKELKEACAMYGLKVVFSPFLARGLSYYNGSVFEIKASEDTFINLPKRGQIKGEGIKETIAGGGSYMIDKTQATGISFSIERLIAVTNMILNIEKMLVVSLGKDKEAIKLAEKLRKQGQNVSVFFGKPSKALEYANYYGIKKVVFVGGKEVKAKKFKIKFMKTGREVLLKS